MAVNSNILKNRNKSLLAPPNTISSTAYSNEVLTTVNNIFTSQDRITIPGRDLNMFDAAPLPLSLIVTNLASASLDVGNATSLSDWNDFFETSIYADTNFTSINVEGTEIQLFGATDLSLRAALFSPSKVGYDWIVSIDDQAGSITDVSDLVFIDCDNLVSVNLPNVKRFGYDTFYSCNNLATVIAPSLLQIDDYAFENCDGLIDVSFPECLFIQPRAFSACDSLETVNLPKVLCINNSSFYSCGALTSLYLPSLLSIGGQDVFNSNTFEDISGTTITFTLPQRLMTCNYGNPQPDVQYLIDNNTVTIIAV